MNNKKGLYVAILVIAIVLGIIIYKNNSVSTNGTENSIQVSDSQSTINEAPIVSSINNTIVSPTSLMLIWKTDRAAITNLLYSTTSFSVQGERREVKDPTPALSHTVEITRLLPDTKYYFSIISINPSNMQKSTTMGEFTTQKPQ